MADWTPPRLIVKVALALGPTDTPSGGDWTDLSDRVRGQARCRRGRGDVRSGFSPGTVTVTLDNTDRMLDPLNPVGLVYPADGNGLPLCPVQISWEWASVESVVFTGFLSGECWQADPAHHGPDSTVELNAVDEMGCSTGLPSEPWVLFTQALAPDWWLRMDGGFPVLADGSLIPNRSGSGGSAIMVSPSGISRYVQPTSYSFRAAPAARIVTYNLFGSVAADIMPDGDENNVTVWCFFATASALGTGESARLMTMVEPGGGLSRWGITLDDDGECHATTYDAGGTLVDTAMIDRTGTGVSRWDDQETHLLIVRFTSGNNMRVWCGGATLTGGDLTATSTVYESDLICGPSDLDVIYDEVALWRRSLSDDTVAGAILATGGQIGPWHGDDWLDRLGHLYDAVGKTVDVDVTDEWHMPSPDPDDGLHGIGDISQVPTTLAAAMEQVASWAGGTAWVTREGRWRVRSVQALDDVTYDAAYKAVTATFTDRDDTLDVNEYRHAGVEPSGTDEDTVINRVEIKFYTRRDGSTDPRPQGFEVYPQDDESVARYGIKSEQFASDWWGWAANYTVSDAMLERYAQPYAGVRTIRLDATGDDDLTTWLAETCELELAVAVTWTPFGADPVTIDVLNIQQIDLQITNETLTCDLTVARS